MRRFSNPSIPPSIKPALPSDPFEAWLVQQAIAGHDRQWLQRNRTVLERRFTTDPSPLPIPPAPEKAYDRMKEI